MSKSRFQSTVLALRSMVSAFHAPCVFSRYAREVNNVSIQRNGVGDVSMQAVFRRGYYSMREEADRLRRVALAEKAARAREEELKAQNKTVADEVGLIPEKIKERVAIASPSEMLEQQRFTKRHVYITRNKGRIWIDIERQRQMGVDIPLELKKQLGPAARQAISRKLKNASYPFEDLFGPKMIYRKRRNPVSRAKALLQRLNLEAMQKMIDKGKAVLPAKIPDVQEGDVIRLLLSNPRSADKYFQGIVIARRNSGISSTIVVRNVLEGIPIERVFMMYSPRIKDAEFVQRRQRKAKKKLFYLRDLPPQQSTFGDAVTSVKVEKTDAKKVAAQK